MRDEIGGPRRRTQAAEYYEPADPARVPPKSLVIGVIVAIALLVGAYVLWRNTLGADTGGSVRTANARLNGRVQFMFSQNARSGSAQVPVIL